MLTYIGIDLSGPSNAEQTALVAFVPSQQGQLVQCERLLGADDHDILNAAQGLQSKGPLIVGIDAPLSYNVGGGDRPSDAQLRKKIVRAGLRSGSVMTPTMTRMVYLTLRGICVARQLLTVCDGINIAEVHPNAAMALGGAQVPDVIGYKQDEPCRARLLAWLEQQHLKGAGDIAAPSDHYVAACAAALAAWKWEQNRSAWIYRADPPIHPFDYTC